MRPVCCSVLVNVVLNVVLERPPGSDYTVEPSPLKIIVIILFTIAFILTLTTHTGQRQLHSNKQDFNLLNVITTGTGLSLI